MSNYYSSFFGQSGETSRWRVCYQRGLPRQVFRHIYIVSLTPIKGPKQDRLGTNILHHLQAIEMIFSKLFLICKGSILAKIHILKISFF